MPKGVKIKDLPPEERPREKLLARGPQALTDVELLAILIRTGIPGRSALDLSEELLRRFDSFRGMAGRSLEEFMEIKGLKGTKVITIAAAFEIARRVVEQVLAEHQQEASDVHQNA